MNHLDWSTLIPLIGAQLAVLVAQVINYLKSRDNGKKADSIHVLVNSGMSKALADNAALAEDLRASRAVVQALEARILALSPNLAPPDRPSRAEIDRAQAVLDASRLPSAAVLAAQAATPVLPATRTKP